MARVAKLLPRAITDKKEEATEGKKAGAGAPLVEEEKSTAASICSSSTAPVAPAPKTTSKPKGNAKQAARGKPTAEVEQELGDGHLVKLWKKQKIN